MAYIGDNPDREGLLETPRRILRSWDKLFGGYKMRPQDVLKTFKEGSCEEMVVLKDIEFYSTCEHHLQPFFGTISIGYLPKGKVLGISKLARLVEVYARRGICLKAKCWGFPNWRAWWKCTPAACKYRKNWWPKLPTA